MVWYNHVKVIEGQLELYDNKVIYDCAKLKIIYDFLSVCNSTNMPKVKHKATRTLLILHDLDMTFQGQGSVWQMKGDI